MTSAPGRAAHVVRAPVSLLADLATTSAAQAVSVLLNALSLAVISRRLGETDLGLYTLERRSMALLQPLILLGLSVATPRWLALARGRGTGDERECATAGTAIVVAAAAVVGAVILVLPRPFAALAFGDPDAVGLARALAGFAFATALFQIVYSLFRGTLQMRRANGLEVAVVGLLPLAVAVAGPEDLVAFMWTLNAGILAATLLALVGQWRRLFTSAVRSAVVRHGRALLRFGLGRTPGDIAIVAMFSIAPLAVVHWSTPVQAGYTSVVQSSLNIVSVAAVPLGVLLLPRVALDLAAHEEGSRKYALLLDATLDVSLWAAGVLFVASPLVIAFWLPSLPPEAITAQRVAALGIPGYISYLVFRSYLDAVDTRPLSSVATLAGLVVLCLLLPVTLVSDALADTVAASLSLAAALCVTGGSVLVFVARRLAGLSPPRAFLPVGLGFAGLVLVGILARGADPAAAAIAGVAGAVAYGCVLVAARRAWIRELAARTRRRPTPADENADASP